MKTKKEILEEHNSIKIKLAKLYSKKDKSNFDKIQIAIWEDSLKIETIPTFIFDFPSFCFMNIDLFEYIKNNIKNTVVLLEYEQNQIKCEELFSNIIIIFSIKEKNISINSYTK